MTIIASIIAALLLAIIIILLIPTKGSGGISLWYAVDKDGTACFYTERPTRDLEYNVWAPVTGEDFFCVSGELRKRLPMMTWEDEPKQITIAAIEKGHD